MNLTRRTVLASAGALAAFAGVSGCSGSNNDDPDAPITIALGGSANNYIPDPDNVISQEIKKATEVNVVAGAMPEDIAASLAAGDSPDVFRVTRNQLNAFVDQGLVLDLSPYEDQLGTYVDFVGQEAADRGRVDQKLSAIARYPNDVNGLTYWIRQDWLDKLDLEIPSTVEEFAEVLTAFTQEDPDQNGKGDTFGLTGASPDQTFRPLWGSFGTPGPGTIYVDDARQVRSGYDDDGITEAISYIAGLHTSKLIDPDSYSVSASEARDRGFQGTAGVLAQAWTEVKKTQAVELSKAANPDAEWVQLDLFPQQDGSPSSIPVAADAVFFALPATLAGNDATIEKIITY
ncbi:MAG TPA: extracellular solute-binding protein, partial [Candidatus Avipropionibacterium avicola]|nr:extracellular solute-binding protein [Candidatus Avipropionibacterium avicola]